MLHPVETVWFRCRSRCVFPCHLHAQGTDDEAIHHVTRPPLLPGHRDSGQRRFILEHRPGKPWRPSWQKVTFQLNLSVGCLADISRRDIGRLEWQTKVSVLLPNSGGWINAQRRQTGLPAALSLGYSVGHCSEWRRVHSGITLRFLPSHFPVSLATLCPTSAPEVGIPLEFNFFLVGPLDRDWLDEPFCSRVSPTRSSTICALCSTMPTPPSPTCWPSLRPSSRTSWRHSA